MSPLLFILKYVDTVLLRYWWKNDVEKRKMTIPTLFERVINCFSYAGATKIPNIVPDLFQCSTNIEIDIGALMFSGNEDEYT